MKMLAPIEPEPAQVLLDGVHVFDVLLGGIGVVHAEIAGPAKFVGDAEIQADAFGMANVQIAVRLRRKARNDTAIPLAGAEIVLASPKGGQPLTLEWVAPRACPTRAVVLAEVARIVGVRELLPLRIDLFRSIGGSALTDLEIAVPAASTDESQIGSEVPVTYVPFRNAHFLSAAVSWAEVLGAKTVIIGAVEQDSSGYPDCRPAYYDAFNQLIKMGTKEGDIRVETPLIAMRKNEIVRLGVELGAPFHVSWSCYSGETEACSVCESCVLRLRAFREAGAVDPLPYAVP